MITGILSRRHAHRAGATGLPEEPSPAPLAKWIGIGLVGLLFVVWAGVFIHRTSFVAIDGERYFCLFDDSMISMRYAWNLAHGNGLAWNPGERVEGITNLLMTLLMAVPTGLLGKSAAVLAVQIAGVGFLLVNLISVDVHRNALLLNAILTLGAVAMTAGPIPALKAARINPTIALRHE